MLDLPSEISSGSRRNEIEPQMPDQSSEDDGLMDRHGSEESRASAQIVNEGSQTFEVSESSLDFLLEPKSRVGRARGYSVQ